MTSNTALVYMTDYVQLQKYGCICCPTAVFLNTATFLRPLLSLSLTLSYRYQWQNKTKLDVTCDINLCKHAQQGGNVTLRPFRLCWKANRTIQKQRRGLLCFGKLHQLGSVEEKYTKDLAHCFWVKFQQVLSFKEFMAIQLCRFSIYSFIFETEYYCSYGMIAFLNHIITSQNLYYQEE